MNGSGVERTGDDAKIWLVLLGIIVLFTGVILYARHVNIEKQKGADVPAVARYTNYAYGVSFRYPPEWLPARGSAQDRYEGESGFFSISAGGTSSIGLDQMVTGETQHTLRPYGSTPDVQALSVNDQAARLILPSVDQPTSMKKQAALIVEYPEPVSINGETYKYFILHADKANIHFIASSLTFVREGE